MKKYDRVHKEELQDKENLEAVSEDVMMELSQILPEGMYMSLA